MSPAGHTAGETAGPESAHGAADAAHPAELSSQVATDVEQSILMAQGGPTVVLPPEGLSLKDHLAETERSLLEQALARSGGNVSQTARLLQLQRTTLIEKLNKYAMRAA